MRTRSLLFVPATSERKIDKAYASDADGVIVDLEDAVAVSEKASARQAIATITAVPRALPTWVRVNAIETPFCYPDLLAVCTAGVRGIVLPKVESAEQLRTVDWLLSNLERQRGLADRSVAIIGIVETARGLINVEQIAAGSERLQQLMFGAIDLAADLSIDIADSAGATDQARFRIACASRAAAITAPLDTAYAALADLDGLRATARRARGLGYAGKACIHPDQITIINEAFTPSTAELAWASKVLEAFEQAEQRGDAAVMLDGQMIDYPVVAKARSVLDRA